MELPRFQSRSVTTPSSISPGQAGAGAAALSEALARGLDVTSQVTGTIARANAEATAENELADIRVRVREFMSRPEWERGDVDGVPVDKAMFDAWQKERAAIEGTTPDIQDFRTRAAFESRRRIILADAESSVVGQMRKVQVDRGRASIAAGVLKNAKAGDFKAVEESIAVGVSSGLYTEQEGLTLKSQMARDMSGRLVDTMPEKVLQALEDGSIPEVANLSPKDANIIREQAQAEIKRRELEAERAKALRDAEARAREAEIKAWALEGYNDALTAIGMGFPAPPSFAELQAAVRTLPDSPAKRSLLKKEAAIVALNNVLTLPPKKLDAALTVFEAQLRNGETNPAALNVLAVGRKLQAEKEKRFREDPVSFGIQSGVVPPPSASPLSAEGMAEAAARSRRLSEFYQEPVPGYTSEEMDAIIRRWGQMGAEDRMNFLGAITETHGQADALTLFQALDDRGGSDMAFAGALAMDSQKAAKYVVAGQVALKENPKATLLPKKEDYLPFVNSEIGGAYGFQSGARDDVIRAVEYAYAGLSVAANDFSGEYKEDRLRNAINAVTGGLVEYNGVKTPAPQRGVSQRVFDAWVRTISPADFSSVAGISPERAYEQFRENGTLVPVAAGVYNIQIDTPAGPALLKGADNRPLELSFDPNRQKTMLDVVGEAVTAPYEYWLEGMIRR